MTESHNNLRVALGAPVALLILAATAVPVEMRELGRTTLNFGISPADFAVNVVGYVPLGLALAGLGSLRAVVAAALISTIAEVSQFAMMHRDPSVTDILANTIGAALGAGASARWKTRPPTRSEQVDRIGSCDRGERDCSLGLHCGGGSHQYAGVHISPGALEAHWKLDEFGRNYRRGFLRARLERQIPQPAQTRSGSPPWRRRVRWRHQLDRLRPVHSSSARR